LGPLLLLPAVLYIGALVGFPFYLAILYSFSDITVGDQSLDLVGLGNFTAVVEDPTFRRSLQNTFVFTFASQALVLVLANILALALTADFRGKWVVRFLILLPWTTPIALGAIGWLWMLDSVFSPIDWILRQLNLLGPGVLGSESNLYWLGRPELAMLSVVLVHVWRMLPLATVIILAGLTSIPQDVKDAAAVDGAGFWRELFQVTVPLMLPIMAVAVLFGVVFTFTDMTVVYVLTRGGPIDRTQVLASWAFFKGIQGGDLAQGAAIALFLLPVLVVVAVLVLRLARRTEVL
jgi:multiple sugar transport system permease protein